MKLNNKLHSNIILFLILTSIFFAEFQVHKIPVDTFEERVESIDSFNSGKEIPETFPLSARSVLIEKKPKGGCWVDDFGDDYGIDFELSNGLDLRDSNVQITYQILTKPIQGSNNTVGLWHFDEGSGTMLFDETKNNNNGTLGGDGLGTDIPVWTSGISNTALRFDGVDDFVGIPDNKSLRLTDAYTIGAWVKPIANKGTSWQTILEKGQDHYGLYLSASGSLQVYNGGLSPASISTSPVAMGNWYFLVATYDMNEGVRRLYLDGKIAATSNHTNSLNAGSGPLGINRHPNNGDSYFNGTIDEVAIYNRSLSPSEVDGLFGIKKYSHTANITTHDIDIPSNMKWSTLVFDETQPPNTYLNMTVLDGSNGQPIPGLQFTVDGEFDISNLDPATYPSIKLKAALVGNGSATPSLHFWGVSWQSEDSFRDTFFGGAQLSDNSGVVCVDGNGQLFRPGPAGTGEYGPRNGYITSESVFLPPDMQWGILNINKSELQGNFINVSILDASSGQPVGGYSKITGLTVDLTTLDPYKYSSIKLHAVFESDAVNTPILYDWTLNWTKNAPPVIHNLSADNTNLYRTNTTTLSVDVSDPSEQKNVLKVKVEHKHNTATTWNDDYLTDQHYYGGLWLINFTPAAGAAPGYYSFRLTCNDSIGESASRTYDDLIEVLNNPPFPPELKISPAAPRTTDDIWVNASNAVDIENEPISYSYSWFKNGLEQVGLTTDMVPAKYTAKHETWKCVVTPNDGLDSGASAEAVIVIWNTPPVLIIEEIPDAVTNNAYEHTFNATDVDIEIPGLSWSMDTTAKWLTMDSHTGRINGTPAYEDAGSYLLKITVTDSSGEKDQHDFTLNVTKENLPPVIKTEDVSSVEVLHNYQADYDAEDDNTPQDKLTWEMDTNASWLNLDRSTGKISGMPTAENIGWYYVNISVSDSEGAMDFHYFILHVVPEPQEINFAPDLKNPTKQPIDGDADIEYTFTVIYFDADSDPPEYIKLYVMGSSFDLDLVSGETYNGTYQYKLILPKGIHTYYFEASDGMHKVKTEEINTNVGEKSKVESSEKDTNYALLFSIIAVIVIIAIIGLLLFFRSRKDDDEIPEQIETPFSKEQLADAAPAPQLPVKVPQYSLPATAAEYPTVDTAQDPTGLEPAAQPAEEAPQLPPYPQESGIDEDSDEELEE